MEVSMSSLSSLSSLASKASESEPDRGYFTCNPSRRVGRKWRTLQLVVLPVVPVLMLVGLNVYQVAWDAHVMAMEHRLLRLSDRAELLASLTTALLREEVALTFWTIVNDSNIRSWHGIDLPERFMETDNLMDDAGDSLTSKWPNARSTMAELRKKSLEGNVTEEELATYETFAAHLTDALPYNESETLPDSVQNYWWSLKQLWDCEVQFAREQLLGIEYFAIGYVQPAKYAQLLATEALVDDHLKYAIQSDPGLMREYEILYLQNQLLKDRLQDLRAQIKHRHQFEASDELAVTWYTMSAKYFDVIAKLRRLCQEKLHEYEAHPEIRRLARNIAFYIMLIFMQVPVLVFIVHNASITTHCIHAIIKMFASKAQELKKERRKAESILREMLPRPLVKKMENGESFEAQEFQSVTVYFGDIAGFDEISAVSHPMQIVNFLNSVYNFLDMRIERYDVYKVETIGCSYMVASGVPVPNRGRHVQEVADMALDIRKCTEDFDITHMPGRRLGFRMGIHSGCCVAGVVGNKMPRYCLFGDTVNTASRMQSTGQAHKIQVSATTAELLESTGKYIIVPRGTMHIKGKGTMSTYWLEDWTEQPVKKRLGVRLEVERDSLMDPSTKA